MIRKVLSTYAESRRTSIPGKWLSNACLRLFRWFFQAAKLFARMLLEFWT
jgi:hypothetical protein